MKCPLCKIDIVPREQERRDAAICPECRAALDDAGEADDIVSLIHARVLDDDPSPSEIPELFWG